jgi:DNA mismatch repair protein MutL
MAEIKRLDSVTASRIAAGEVVERPLNVVKVLVEIALDAGASRISVEMDDGGEALIRVTDNGAGIPYEELPLTVERFATSKVETVEDVYSVHTFGFRGEALAAVSSVSEFSIKSVRQGDEAGELSVLYGKDPVVKPSAISEGTQVTVAKLFSNLPVRKKFMKTPRANEGEVQRFIKQFALVNPGVDILLYFNGREVFRNYAAHQMIDTAKTVFNEDRLAYYKGEYENSTVHICLSHPVIRRGRRDSIYIGVNGRVIKDAALQQAILQAYHRVMPHDVYPLAALNLRLSPEGVDVNIHPNKQEVRFEALSTLFGQVRDSAEAALLKFTSAAYVENDESINDEQIEDRRPRISDLNLGFAERSNPYMHRTSAYREEYASPVLDLTKEFTVVQSFENSFSEEPTAAEDDLYRVIGQLADMYIVCETPDGSLALVDQHVAHERVLYEKYRDARASVTPSVTLFEPIVLKLAEDELAALFAIEEELTRFGYGFERFGPQEVKLTRAPVDSLKKNLEKELAELVQDALEHRRSNSQDAAILTMSCRNAIKAGDKVSVAELQELMRALMKCANPHTCPHGRPIIYSLSPMEIAKKFHRA